ncbi:MAG TPA: acyl-CoA dehydrogenase family protein [Ilumatobacter sp.]|nr:acyl-CoA dehydrogenase family protein [Ilumatobacter sp.]
MDFDDTPEEAAYRAEARSWLERHAQPLTDAPRPRPGMSDAFSEAEKVKVIKAKAWQATLADHGWAGITWPTEYGGRGGTSLQQRVFLQEQAKFDVPAGVFAQSIGMAGPTIIAHGTPEQKERFLRPMLRGDELWCQLFSEPGAGSDLAGLTTKAVRDGDEFMVSGQKVWTSSAHYSDWGILLARTDFDAPKHRGITYFLVDMKTPGIDIRPIKQITGTAHFNEVFLTDVRIPADGVVGTVNNGWGPAMTTLTAERTLIAGNTNDTFADLVRLARRFERLGEPTVRQELADTYIRLNILKYLGWRSQTRLSHGKPPGPESSVAKLGYSAHLERLGNLGVAISGASGMLLPTDDEEVHAWGQQLLGQWSARIGGGTDQVQRNIMGERVLGLPGDIRVDKNVAFSDLPK